MRQSKILSFSQWSAPPWCQCIRSCRISQNTLWCGTLLCPPWYHQQRSSSRSDGHLVYWSPEIRADYQSISTDQNMPNKLSKASTVFLPLWTQPSLVQQPGHRLYEALLSWHHQPPLQRSMLQSQTLLIACCWDPSSPTNNKIKQQ